MKNEYLAAHTAKSLDPLSPDGAVDVVIVGAGIGGLSAALHLLKAGFTVAIVERLPRVGGLCGTFELDGYEFVIACNDFGLDMEKTMQALDVPVRFRRYRTQVFHRDRRLHLPPKPGDIPFLAWRWRDLLSYSRALEKSRGSGAQALRNVEALVKASVRCEVLQDLLKLPGYLMGTSPALLPCDALHAEMDFKYGYWQPIAPEGGPQAMVNLMAENIRSRGGHIILSTEFKSACSDARGKSVRTTRGNLRCRYVVTTQEKPNHYPEQCELGLPICMFGLVIDAKYEYPKDIHTHIYYPPHVSLWADALDQGRRPSEFAFHIFKSDLAPRNGCYTANVYFYLPRGCESPERSTVETIRTFIFNRLDKMLPGIARAIRAHHFVSPAQFATLHQLNGRVTPVMVPPGFPKPENYCRETDLYYAGASAYPPGDHAGAAMRSGALVANLIAARSAGNEAGPASRELVTA